jgi:protein-S-isoprenylcysteine O-methyltransferase Ste14
MMRTVDATTENGENVQVSNPERFLTRFWVDKAFAVLACVPLIYPLVRYYHDLSFNVDTVTWLLDLAVIVSTMFFRRTAVRVMRNPLLWLLTCVATYWFFMIGFMEQPGRRIAPLWITTTLSILSTLIELWGRFSLGRNIGFVPAQREVVTRGAYRFMRHPIYTGLFIWILAYWLGGYSPLNTLLYSLSIFWWVIKSFVEEGFLKKDPGYAAYMKRVPWRWIPGVM